ncbi:hypothetical protein [Botrimarina hoheduenensis]|uniref:Chromosome partition protein Smc n=1 Tax=Botrimarina hoheduenensis TaxID=2528000 RepID=A0A5C5VZX6_9BACT|nr:hypothetical protein [Botrimarina hoheduenensis]TWT43475.1 hypothetical protein Pla111_24260 [Botrimarina hoheduenensis]
MPDYTVYDSEQELRERIEDLNNLLSDYEKTQGVLDEERGVLADQVQGAKVIYDKQLNEFEQRVSAYEQKRDDLDRRQREVAEGRADALENREVLQLQLDAKRGKKMTDRAAPKVDGAAKGVGQADGAAYTTGPTTREQIDQLKAQLSKPEPALALDPPGMGESQASVIDRDLKLMAKIKAKEQKLDDASQKLKDEWNQAKGPKR